MNNEKDTWKQEFGLEESYCWILDLQDSESSGSMYFSVAYQRFHALEQSKSWWMLLWNHCDNCVIELVSFLTPNVKIININIKYYMNLSFFHVSGKTCLNCHAIRPYVIIWHLKWFISKWLCFIWIIVTVMFLNNCSPPYLVDHYWLWCIIYKGFNAPSDIKVVMKWSEWQIFL